MIEARISRLPAAPLHALEIWSNPAKVAARIKKAVGLALPPMGQSAAVEGLRLIRIEPTVWLVEGEPAPLLKPLGEDGALTAIGGGVVRIELAGPGWRRVLMERGAFDAESLVFAPGCAAATVIDHVNVRLLVTAPDSCLAFVPASFAADLIEMWERAAQAPA